jgi:putative membrane protein
MQESIAKSLRPGVRRFITMRNLLLAALSIAYMVMWFGGVVSHGFFGALPANTEWTAPTFLLLAGLLVLLSVALRELPELIIAAILGFVIEVVGVWYGFVFGHYEYTDALRPKFLGVPLVMACAWMVLFAYIRRLMTLVNWSPWAKVVTSSCWITLIDLVIDPLAAGGLDYWRWKESGSYYGIPWHNFIGWFAASLMLFGLAEMGRRQTYRAIVGSVGLSIILFFTVIALARALFIAGAVGMLLCLAHLVMLRTLPLRRCPIIKKPVRGQC